MVELLHPRRLCVVPRRDRTASTPASVCGCIATTRASSPSSVCRPVHRRTAPCAPATSITAVGGQSVATHIDRRRRRCAARTGRHDGHSELPPSCGGAHCQLAPHAPSDSRRDCEGHRLGHDYQGECVLEGVGAKVSASSPRPRARGTSPASCSTCGATRAGCSTRACKTASVFLDGGPVVTFQKRGAAPLQLTAARRW